MEAKRCDRCGNFFTGDGCNPSIFTNPDGRKRTIFVDTALYNIDLCGACKGELREWWNAKGAPTDVQPDVNEEE